MKTCVLDIFDILLNAILSQGMMWINIMPRKSGFGFKHLQGIYIILEVPTQIQLIFLNLSGFETSDNN